MKLQAPVLLAVVIPAAPPLHARTTVAFATAVPVSVTVSLELTTAALMTGAAGAASCTFTPNTFEAALAPAEVVSVVLNAQAPVGRSAVVKLQAPVLLAVVVPIS